MCHKQTAEDHFFEVGRTKFIARLMFGYLLSVGSMFAQFLAPRGFGMLVQVNVL